MENLIRSVSSFSPESESGCFCRLSASVEELLCYMATKRKLRQEWLMNRDFQPWLSPLENDPTKAFCSTCKTQMNAELTTIKRHKTSRLHVKLLQETETQEAAQSDRPDEAARISAGAIRNLCFRGDVLAYI
ncbi:hypothetical protein Pcinc_015309 [Petrolisthes cinctipes]|uniref:Uncharacterized protein n=1 Tax=Petrolisthes cinctipes TaxID=88211 RepID=A0AAE1KQK8_PETCI|nr:hypothetical protein Pcinc_015309 [Petrolisthes cinctipes]